MKTLVAIWGTKDVTFLGSQARLKNKGLSKFSMGFNWNSKLRKYMEYGDLPKLKIWHFENFS